MGGCHRRDGDRHSPRRPRVGTTSTVSPQILGTLTRSVPGVIPISLLDWCMHLVEITVCA